MHTICSRIMKTIADATQKGRRKSRKVIRTLKKTKTTIENIPKKLKIEKTQIPGVMGKCIQTYNVESAISEDIKRTSAALISSNYNIIMNNKLKVITLVSKATIKENRIYLCTQIMHKLAHA